MIIFLTTPEHSYTHAQVRDQAAGIHVQVVPYDRVLLKRGKLPREVYVFTDLDRLSPPQLRSAAKIHRQLKQGGATVLNDPARFMSRWGLLRALYNAGINRFNAYRAEEQVRPERWPVFVRAEGGHDGPLSELLHSWDDVQRALDAALAEGTPLNQLLIVEYAAEPVAPGLYRKLSSFRIGAQGIAHNCVHDTSWVAKRGTKGVASDELYREELRIARENPHAAEIARAFDIAAIDYGRADFGLVGGRIQVYEINTNPDVKFATEHPSPLRLETYRIFKESYFRALRALDRVAAPAA